MYCRDNGNSLEIFSLLLMKEYVCFIIFRVLSMAVYDLSYFYWNIFSHTFFCSLLFNVHVENFSEVNNITNPPMYCDFFSSFFFFFHWLHSHHLVAFIFTNSWKCDTSVIKILSNISQCFLWWHQRAANGVKTTDFSIILHISFWI